MNDIKSNSKFHKTQPQKPKNEKIISGTAKVKKKNVFMNMFQEDVTSTKDYILQDVIIPAIKRTITDVVSNGIDMLLYGEVRNPRTTAGRVSYSGYYSSIDRNRFNDRNRTMSNNRFAEEDCVFETRGEAELVLTRLDEMIEQYDVVSVADLKELSGLIPRHTDFDYGWTCLGSASTERTRDGYVIKMPPARPIK